MASFSRVVLALGAFAHAAYAGQWKRGDGFIAKIEEDHKLRICNAFPYAAAMDIYLNDKTKLTEKMPMPYKTCRDFRKVHLAAGDKIDFKIGDASTGTFSVSDLPTSAATLMLVVHRHDTITTSVAFESHVFTGSHAQTAQVAIIDTYKGSHRSTPRIRDEKAVKAARSEQLRYDSVVAVRPGKYDVELDGNNESAVKARSSFVALKGEDYVVLRTGVEAQAGESHPEDVFIFPQSDPAQLPYSAAPTPSAAGGMFAALMALSLVVA
eukprot:TRINITY_DN165_c0_g2_i1.p1 TRINITY_DN165_c0_g2~~TRINITY_DN165_c0_g2_i1.p1  ORF type:complete len:267 (+),score=68.20 TRINITY_DN165_c0_g2_i1:115-915(+)